MPIPSTSVRFQGVEFTPSPPARRSRRSIHEAPSVADVPDVDEVFDVSRNRRRSRYSTVNSSSESDEHTLGPLERAIAALTQQQKKEQYDVCMKFFGGNKVTPSNAFTLHLIECLYEMADPAEPSAFDFQKVSLTLQASTKIYGARVDALHSDAINILSDVNKNQPSEDSTSNRESDAEEDNVPDKPKKAKKAKKSFLQENIECLNLPIEKISSTLPHLKYQEISQALDPNSHIPGLMFVNECDKFNHELNLEKDYPIYIDPNTYVLPENEEKFELLETFSKGYFRNISELNFRRPPISFLDEKWPIVNEDFHFEEPSIVENADEVSSQNNSYEDVHDLDNGEIADDGVIPSGPTSTDIHANNTEQTVNDFRRFQNLDSLASNLFDDSNVYECFDPELLAAAANINSVREKGQLIVDKHKSGTESHIIRRRVKKKKIIITAGSENDNCFQKGKRVYLYEKTEKSWLEESKISCELKYDLDTFKEFKQGAKIQRGSFDYNSDEDDDVRDTPSELNLSVNNLDDDMDDVAQSHEESTETHSTMDPLWANLFDNNEPKKTEFAHFAFQKVNHRKLTSEITKIIFSKKIGGHQTLGYGDVNEENQDPNRDQNYMQLSDVHSEVRKRLNQGTVINSFASLLHVAASTNLELEQQQDLTDVRIHIRDDRTL